MEREISQYLSAPSPEVRWGLLPERLRGIVGAESEWLRLLKVHSISVQAPYNPGFGTDEAAYLNEVLTASRERGMLYPYHLAEAINVCKTLDSPFEFYVEMIIERMRSERSYDTIPSFAAADCVRLVQCGRNEFIHALNACRSKGWLWKRRRNLIAQQLPSAPPIELPVSHWWEVHATRAAAGALAAASSKGRHKAPTAASMRVRASSVLASLRDATAKDARPATTEGSSTGEGEGEGEGEEGGGGGGSPPPAAGTLSAIEIETLHQVVSGGGDGEVMLAGVLPREALATLYAAGLVRFGVAVGEADRIEVRQLTGFVMNRVGNDYLEKLLYEIFVSNDEATTLGNLAALLQQPAELVTRAASIACRLGFARKLTAPSLTASPPGGRWNGSWLLEAEENSHATADGVTGGPAAGAHAYAAATDGDQVALKRVALLVDSKMAACLMMSNLNDRLKQHAVTLYEVGKIPHEALDPFVAALTDVERPAIDEADVLEYFDQAIALCKAITFLRADAACELDGKVRPLDIVRTESLATLEPSTRDRVLARSYELLISMAPMVPSIEHIFTPSLAVAHFGPTYHLLVSPWVPIALCQAMGRGPVSFVLPRGTRLRALPRLLHGVSHVLLTPWKGEPLVIGTGSLLSVASELLLRSPLLVQEHVADVAALTASVALPLDSSHDGGADERPASPGTSEFDISDAMASGGAGGVQELRFDAHAAAAEDEEGSAAKEALALQRVLELDASIGIVQLVRLPRTGEAPAGELKPRWLPLCVHFGLPLSDVQSCDAACAAIAAHKLFTAESIARHAAALSALLGRVEKCVSFAQLEMMEEEPEEDAMTADEELSLGDEGAYPPTPLLFDGAELRQLSDVAELY